MSETSLLEKISSQMVTAMKQKDTLRLSVLRMLKTALTNEKIAGKKDLSPEVELAVVSRLAKQRTEAAAEFHKAARPELASKEEQELTILQEFLPQQLSEAELDAMIDSAIVQSQAKEPRDLGAVMKILAPQVKGRADGKTVSQAVMHKLSLA